MGFRIRLSDRACQMPTGGQVPSSLQEIPKVHHGSRRGGRGRGFERRIILCWTGMLALLHHQEAGGLKKDVDRKDCSGEEFPLKNSVWTATYPRETKTVSKRSHDYHDLFQIKCLFLLV